jgi:hypothetical protein
MFERVNGKDLLGGALLLALAAYCGLTAWMRMKVGTPRSMGPGYFPLMLSMALAPLAVLMILRGFRGPTPPVSLVGLRPLLLTLAAPALFGLLVARAGFAPALAATTIVAALADRRMGLKEAALLALFMTALSTALFVYALQLPVQLFGPIWGI